MSTANTHQMKPFSRSMKRLPINTLMPNIIHDPITYHHHYCEIPNIANKSIYRSVERGPNTTLTISLPSKGGNESPNEQAPCHKGNMAKRARTPVDASQKISNYSRSCKTTTPKDKDHLVKKLNSTSVKYPTLYYRKNA